MKEDVFVIGATCVMTMDDQDLTIQRGGVAFSDRKILEVGSFDALVRFYQPEKQRFYENAVILPGLINAHTHETLTRGLHEGMPLMEWLDEICIPIERNYSREDLRAAALMTQLELIRGGVTTFADLFRFIDVAIEVAGQTGLRGVFAPQFFDVSQNELESIEKTVDLIRQYNGRYQDRVRVWFGPHAPYTCCQESYSKVATLARDLNVGIHTHLCETISERDSIQCQCGVSPVRMLEEAGVFDVPCILAHCVHLLDDEISLLSKKSSHVGVVYNPLSNMKLADGIAPITRYIEQGVPVALGTDSNLSNNGLDLFNEMRIGSYLQRVSNMDATLLSAKEMLRMATRGGARVLHLDDQIGSLERGKCADLIVVDFSKPHLWPIFWDEPSNIAEQLVYSSRASDVITTIVDGQHLMEDGRVLTVDENIVFDFVQNQAHSLYARTFPSGK